MSVTQGQFIKGFASNQKDVENLLLSFRLEAFCLLKVIIFKMAVLIIFKSLATGKEGKQSYQRCLPILFSHSFRSLLNMLFIFRSLIVDFSV